MNGMKIMRFLSGNVDGVEFIQENFGLFLI